MDIAHTTQLIVFFGMFMGCAIKVPMFPFHTCLPDAHTQAPTQGSVILAAVLLKLGTYGFIRVALPILPEAAQSWAPWIGGLAVIGIIYGALGCLAQTDMKRSEEHTSELQSLMRTSYAVFCLKKKNKKQEQQN